MPTREEMIAAIRSRRAASAPMVEASATPSREEMIATIRARKAGGQTAIPKVMAPESQDVSILDKVGEGLQGAKEAGQMAGRVLDYPGGLARTAIAQVASPYVSRAQNKDLNLVNTQDWLDALKGQAPTSSEYMKRAQVPEMGKVDVPYLGEVTGRGALGLATDIATDPLNLVNKIGQGVEALGKTAYKSGLKAIDLEGAKYAKDPVSDLLVSERATGSMESIQKQMDDLAEKALTPRNVILKEARAGEGDMRRAMSPVLNEIYSLKLHGTPEQKNIAEIFEKRANAYIKLGGKKPEEILRELPVGGKYSGSHTALDTIRGEGGALKYKRMPVETQLAETLPSPKDYVPDYRAVTIPGAPGGRLPVGQVEPLGTDLATKFRDWLKIKENPQAILKGQAPLTNEGVLMGQIMPEGTTHINRVAGFSQTPGQISGKYMPANFTPQKPQTVLDITAGRMGPSPLQMNKWKSAGYNRLPQSKYAQAAQTSTGQDLEKLMNYGLKTEIENTVGRTSGSMAQGELADYNDRLSRLLTSKEKAASEAAKELKKNNFTSVDAILGAATAAGTHNPATTAAVLGAKKLADFSKGTRFRTTGGLALSDIGQGLQKIPTGSAAVPRLLYSPWLKLKDNKNE